MQHKLRRSQRVNKNNRVTSTLDELGRLIPPHTEQTHTLDESGETEEVKKRPENERQDKEKKIVFFKEQHHA